MCLDTMYLSFFKVPCHLQRRWQPHVARVFCPLRPWWALLDSLYLSNKCISYSTCRHFSFGIPSLSCRPLLLLPPDFRDHAVSWHVLESSAAVAELSSLTHAAHQQLSSLPHSISAASCSKVKFLIDLCDNKSKAYNMSYTFSGWDNWRRVHGREWIAET